MIFFIPGQKRESDFAGADPFASNCLQVHQRVGGKGFPGWSKVGVISVVLPD